MFSKIKDISFDSGIRAKDIDYNFKFVDHKLNNGRLYSTGDGIATGFNMTISNNFTVKISPGICVNSSGEEIEILKDTILNIAEPDYSEITEKKLVSDGRVNLSHIPYAPEKTGYVDYNFLSNHNNYISVTDFDNVTNKIGVTNIHESTLIVDSSYNNKYVNVKYNYSYSRIDTVVINSLGDIKIYKGLMSASPTRTDLSNCKEEIYIIGLVEVITDYNSYIILHQDLKEIRPITVVNDTIYFYGKKYEDANISFDKPQFPKAYDLWYDKDNNILMVYYPIEEDTFEWIPVNTIINTPITEVKIFDDSNWPEDSQTFMFDEDRDINMLFEPDVNSLEIIIDNAVVMKDQFTEIVDSSHEYVKRGIGFKLVDPLDRPTIIECRVNHIITAFPLPRKYQRASFIVDENYSLFDGNINIDKVFKTKEKYLLGENQLEVYAGGKKLIKDFNFQEIDIGSEYSDTFKILSDLSDGEVVYHKISKMVCSYDTMEKYIEPLTTKIDEHDLRLEKLEKAFTNLSSNVNDKISIINTTINSVKSVVDEIENTYYRKEDTINKSSIPNDIISSLYSGYENTIVQCDPIITLSYKMTDTLIIFYNNQNHSRILTKDIDYTLSQNILDNTKVDINLIPDLIDINSYLNIVIIKFGENV